MASKPHKHWVFYVTFSGHFATQTILFVTESVTGRSLYTENVTENVTTEVRMNGVIYARYSSHNQREESIEGQIRRCKEFAEQNNITIIGEYIDRAITGKTDKRDSFQRLIADSERGRFQAIIMYTLDRFARNRYDAAHYKAKLKKNGVRLFYTEQSITDEPEGIILESVLEGMAEYYSENLSRGVKRGMHENALKCMITGGYMPLGYKKTEDKHYEIDPATAPIVREIFDLYANGKSQRQIVDILNEKGYKTVRGKPFKFGSLSSILTNKKYIGLYSFDDVEIENGIPAIVDKETFDKAQDMLKRNKRTTGRMKAPATYMLTGKLYCGHCGSTMVGESGTSGTGIIYNYYKCSDRKKHRGCTKKVEKKNFLEETVVRETTYQIMQPGVIEGIAENVAKLAEKEFNNKSRLISLQNELNQTQTAISNLLKLVEKGIDTDDVGKRLLDLNAVKSGLIKQINKEESKRPVISKERIIFFLKDMLSHNFENDTEYQQRIIDTLVDKVFVFDEEDGDKKIVITYNTSRSIKSGIKLSTVKSSDFNGFALPLMTNPNFFVAKDGFGLVIKIPSGV